MTQPTGNLDLHTSIASQPFQTLCGALLPGWYPSTRSRPSSPPATPLTDPVSTTHCCPSRQSGNNPAECGVSLERKPHRNGQLGVQGLPYLTVKPTRPAPSAIQPRQQNTGLTPPSKLGIARQKSSRGQQLQPLCGLFQIRLSPRLGQRAETSSSLLARTL